MATLNRRPELPNSRDYQLVEANNELSVFWFIPDCPSFGFWTDEKQAQSARETWLKNYRCAKQSDWQKYCQSQGYREVKFQ